MKKEEKVFEYPEETIQKIRNIWERNGYKMEVMDRGRFIISLNNFATSKEPLHIRFVEFPSGEKYYSVEYYDELANADVDMKTFSLISRTLSVLGWYKDDDGE